MRYAAAYGLYIQLSHPLAETRHELYMVTSKQATYSRHASTLRSSMAALHAHKMVGVQNVTRGAGDMC